jgi:hypothetical protein
MTEHGLAPSDWAPSSGVRTVRNMGNSTGSMPTSKTFDCRTDTLSSTTMRRKDGSRQASRKAEAGAHRVPR